MMKKIKLIALLATVLAVAATVSLSAQYDDLYYDPDKDGTTYTSSSYASSEVYDDDFDGQDYDDEYYDYYYTSRIKRFYRPYYGFGYYDPVYVDSYYYGQPFSPAITVLIYDSPFGYNNYYNFRRLSRWNRWNNYGYAGWNSYDPWYSGGFRSGWGGGFNNYYTVNNYYGGGFGGFGGGFGGYGGAYGYGGGYASNYYCPPTWGSGYGYSTVNSVRNNTNNAGSSYGPRTYGSTRVSRTDNGREDVRNSTNTGPTRNRSIAETPETGRTRAPENAGSLERHTIRPESGATTQPERSRNTGRTVDPQTDRPSRNFEPRSSNPRTYERNTPSRTIDRAPAQSAPNRTYDRPRESPSRTIDRSPSTPRSSGGGFDRSSTPRSSGGSIDRSSSSPRSSGGSIDRGSSAPRSSGSSGGGAPSRSRGGGQ